MFQVIQTEEFADWLHAVRDRKAVKVISQRILRVQAGLFGDVEPVGEGVAELRIHYGPGYRLYFTKQGQVVIILLCGGDKSSQARDIVRAKALAKEI